VVVNCSNRCARIRKAIIDCHWLVLNNMRILILAGLVGMTAISTAHAADSGQAADIAARENGRDSAQLCRHCHGVAGVSPHGDVPNLAGQNAAYLLDQMNKFAAGQRRSELMEGLIKALTPEQRASIALYFSRQTVMPQPVKNAAQLAEGKKLYARLCIYCHGATGYGADSIPRLAGQQTAYLQLSLKRYRNGGGERIDPQMQAYTRGLKDHDIANLAAYLGSLR
jgi:cytochrome c553